MAQIASGNDDATFILFAICCRELFENVEVKGGLLLGLGVVQAMRSAGHATVPKADEEPEPEDEDT